MREMLQLCTLVHPHGESRTWERKSEKKVKFFGNPMIYIGPLLAK